MINNVNNNSNLTSNSTQQNSNSAIDINNCSLNELRSLLCDLVKNDEVSLKDCLLLMPLEMDELEKELGCSNIKFMGYFAHAWNNPNKKMNLLQEYNSILNNQISNNEPAQDLQLTRGAISVLEKIQNKYSFQSILNNEMSS